MAAFGSPTEVDAHAGAKALGLKDYDTLVMLLVEKSLLEPAPLDLSVMHSVHSIHGLINSCNENGSCKVLGNRMEENRDGVSTCRELWIGVTGLRALACALPWQCMLHAWILCLM